MIIMNNKKDFLSLSKKVALGEDLHQVSGAMSLRSPVEYTLETSRSAGKSFAALGALQAIGKTGFQFFLANLVEKTTLIRELLSCEDDIKIVNQSDLGFVVMVRIYPPEKVTTREMIEEFTSLDTKVREFINIINDYNEQFFKWDKNRMLKSEEINYSFTRKYLEVPSGSYIAALKIYPVSPYLDYEVSRGLVETILHQKDSFDQNIWCKY